MILLINDDGIHAPGLRLLYQQLRESTRTPVLVVAPVTQQSGQSHAITLDRGLTVSPHLEDDFFGFAVDGTPTDCLKLALKVLCPQPPRLVISGINDGPNVGRSLFYSGTVAVAMEAAVEGQIGLAVSRDHGAGDLREAATFTAGLARRCLGQRDLRGRVLNVNLPALPRSDWRPLQEVKHGLSGFDEGYLPKRTGNRMTWQLMGERVELDGEGETDAHLLRAGTPTLTVLSPNVNCGRGLNQRLTKQLFTDDEED